MYIVGCFSSDPRVEIFLSRKKMHYFMAVEMVAWCTEV